MAMARTQTLVQLTDDLVARLDERAAAARRSRSDLIREALEHYLTSGRAAAIDAAIVEGYERMPPAEDLGAAWAAAASLSIDPWTPTDRRP